MTGMKVLVKMNVLNLTKLSLIELHLSNKYEVLSKSVYNFFECHSVNWRFLFETEKRQLILNSRSNSSRYLLQHRRTLRKRGPSLFKASVTKLLLAQPRESGSSATKVLMGFTCCCGACHRFSREPVFSSTVPASKEKEYFRKPIINWQHGSQNWHRSLYCRYSRW